jgi:hypothetical protein
MNAPRGARLGAIAERENSARDPSIAAREVAYDGTTGGDLPTKGTTTMGDKSPKAAKKQASQKQAKNDRADQQKRQAVAAKQVPGKK